MPVLTRRQKTNKLEQFTNQLSYFEKSRFNLYATHPENEGLTPEEIVLSFQRREELINRYRTPVNSDTEEDAEYPVKNNDLEEDWDIVDDTHEEHYRDFIISGRDAKKRVDSFYKWLNDGPTKSNKEFVLNVNDYTNEQLENLLEANYNQEYIWDLVCKHGASYNYLTNGWSRLLKLGFVELQRRYISETQKQSDSSKKRDIILKHINRTLIKFHRVYTIEQLHNSPQYVILKSVLKKQLELLKTNGMPEAFLLFAHLRPDLVYSNCRPYINKSGPYYNNDYNKYFLETAEYKELYNRCKQYLN